MSASLRLLGPVEVFGRTGRVQLGGPKERCLLAVLAVHAGEVVAEDRLIDALWDGAPPRTASKTLQNYVLRLRRVLNECDGAAIVTRPPGYSLDVGATDAALAESLIADGRREAEHGEYATALARFDEALALWRGPAINEFADRPFARSEAARLDQLRESAAEDRVAAVLALGRHREAVATCEMLVAAQPLRERRWIQLMLALYRDGRQAEALEAYRRLSAVLTEQLGIDPGPEARQLEEAMLAHDELLVPRPVGGSLAGSRISMTPCFGRDRELATLLGHVDAAAAGGGGVVLLRGEPGIGKTRLLAELAAAAALRGARVLSGRCIEGVGALPFHPFAEAIDAHLHGADLPPGAAALELLLPPPPGQAAVPAPPGPPLQPDELRLRLFDGLVRFLADLAAVAPVVLLLDDLHWADDGTVAMLRHTARSTAGRRLLVVGSYRGSEVTGEHPLGDALDVLRSEAECGVVRLAGIGRDAIERLLGATVGGRVAADLVAAVWAETDGNPFFAREVVRHLQEDGALRAGPDGRLYTALPLSAVPDGVRYVIRRRRRRLTKSANRLLDVAAAIDGPFLFEPVRTVAGLSDSDGLGALDEALDAGLVVPDAAPDRYDFTHALIQHTVYQELNPSRRLRLHLDVAEALAAARSEGARVGAAEIAVQYHRAATLPAAGAGVAPALEAADRARASGAHDEQATFLQIACDLLTPGDDLRPELLGRRAVALAWSLRFDEAVEAARAAAAAGSRDAVLAEVAMELATAGSNRHAWLLAAEGLDSATGPDGDDPVTWATLTLLDLDRREAADSHHPGMPLDLPGRRTALRIMHESGRLAGRGDLARYAVAAIHSRRERVPSHAAVDPTVAAFLLGDYAAAVPLFAREADAAQSRGQLAWAVYCRAGEARCQVALGELAVGAVTLGRVRALVARVPGLELGWQLLHHQGAEDALVAALDEGWPKRMADFAPWLRPGPDRHWGNAAISSIGARVEARMGHVDAAMTLLATPIRALRQAPAWAPNYCRMACEVAETLWLLNRRDHLSVVESALRDKALPADFRFPMTDARLALARLCALAGQSAEASNWFDAARAALDAQGAQPLRAVVDHDEALMHLRAGDPDAATPFVVSARADFERLGMTGWVGRLARSVASSSAWCQP
jgi:DNA-binding SARP family transcriptional activator